MSHFAGDEVSLSTVAVLDLNLMRSLEQIGVCGMVILAVSCLMTGCAAIPYHYGQNLETPLTLELRPSEEQIERGRPVGFVDGLGHYFFSLPSKLLLFSWKVDNHAISPQTEAVLREYLAANGLQNVKVRLNQYAPGGEWRRLFKNREMPGFFRFTFGLLASSFYMILPDRVFAGLFGGDHYNPFTNTINLYSDSAVIALHEGAHAKDFARRPRAFKGWYAFLGILPLTPLYQEAVATGDAIGYVKEKRAPDREKEAYKILYPAYCTYIAGEGLTWVPVDIWISYLVQLGAVVPGHITGRFRAALVEDVPPATDAQ